MLPAKSAGFSSNASLDMTPSACVSRRQGAISAKCSMPPFARTGISGKAARTCAISCHRQGPILSFFSSRVRPCTVSTLQPASMRIRHSSIVSSILGSRRILQVTGTLNAAESLLTISRRSSHSSRRNAPYRPRRAMPCGQPRLRSTASHWCSTSLAARTSVSASLPQNCTKRGRSSAQVLNARLRYRGSFAKSRECSIGV
mmetsp:Transcript_11476/g.42837  ORF Transcript_11476/g.42837 Transcript_11476/m.42837 type:complete len:201 (-) Transcript_11476:158-760(-)